jgi:hypothetical protein
MQLRQACGLVRPFQVIARVVVWYSVVTAKPDPAAADIFWVTRPTFDRSQLPMQVEVLFNPVVAKLLYGIDVLPIPEGSAYLAKLLNGLSVTGAFTKRGLVEATL